MKKAIIILAAMVALAACKKETVTPQPKKDCIPADSLKKWLNYRKIMGE